MTCNCDNDGSNEYIIELGEFGLPGAKGDRGEQGYSPVVSYTTNSDTIQFTLVNENSTLTTPNYYDYLAKKDLSNSPIYTILSDYPTNSQVASTYLTIANASDTYFTKADALNKLNKDGSNATNPITLNSLTFSSSLAQSSIKDSLGLYVGNGGGSSVNNSYINIPNAGANGTLDIHNNGTIRIQTEGSYTATYNGNEIATINQIPTVGNGTITITQGGVTKGTFTLNQSGNATIALDAGGGSITNPLIIEDDVTNNEYHVGFTTISGNRVFNSGIYLNGQTGYSVGNICTAVSFTPLTYVDASTIIPGLAGAKFLQLKYDNNTLKVNQNGELYADISAPTYTAGDGIDITSDVISVSDIQDLDTIKIANGYSTGEGIYGWLQDGSDTVPLVRIDNLDAVVIGNSSSDLVLQGDKTRPDYYNGATKSLALYSDVPTSDTIEAHKAYLADGDLLTDPEGLADVKEYAHSTFDASKFTVTGSPVITDDGIASGFNSANGIYYPTLTPGTKSWEIGIEQEITAEGLEAISSSTNFVFFTDGADKGVNVQTYHSSTNFDNFTVNIKFSDGTTSRGMNCNSGANGKCSVGDIQKCVLGYDGTDTYYFKAYKNGVLYASSSYTTSTSQVLGTTASYNTIGFRKGSRGTKNKINLKTFYEKIDGIITLSGNKTGIDTIKPDDYTVVGSPTITDGVVSGMGNNTDYIIANYVIGEKPFKIRFNCSYESTTIGRRLVQIGSGNNRATVYTQWGTLRFAFTGQDSSTFTTIYLNNIYGNNVVGEIEFTGTKYILRGSADGGATWSQVEQESTIYAKDVNTVPIYIGQSADNVTFDLNAFKIYVDGNLVYQPCLKIPYTLSKTGSKVVNAMYRPRVNDMAEQFGYANYYTLDETNSNFTLPMGEIYGYITRLETLVTDLQSRLTALESNINGGGAGVTQLNMMSISPLSLNRPQLLGEFNLEDEINTMDIEPIEDDIQEEELEPQEAEEETEEGGQDE